MTSIIDKSRPYQGRLPAIQYGERLGAPRPGLKERVCRFFAVLQSALAIPLRARATVLDLRKAAAEQATVPRSSTGAWRRADWRFLTTRPWPERSLVIGSRLSQPAALFSREMFLDAAEPASCEMAVLENPDRKAFQAASKALQPGGALYAEWDGWRIGGLGRLRKKMAEAGFARVRVFFPYPAGAAPRFWLPQENPLAPLRYLIDQAFPDNPIARAVLPRLIAFAARHGFMPGRCVISRKEGPTGSTDLIDLINRTWMREKQRSQPAVLLRSGGSLLTDKITALVFDQEAVEPGWVVKINRVRQDGLSLLKAQVMLEQTNALFMQIPALQIPRNLFVRELNGAWIAGQTAIPGQPLSSQTADLARVVGKVTDFLANMALISMAEPRQVIGRSGVETLLAGLNRLPGGLLAPAELERARARLACLASAPAIWGHNDLSPWNIYQSPGQIGVLDWSAANWDALPLLDLVYLLANLSFMQAGADAPATFAEAYTALLDPSTPLGELFARETSRYMDLLELPADLIPALRLATWVYHSGVQARRLAREGGRRAVEAAFSQADSPVIAALRVEVGIRE